MNPANAWPEYMIRTQLHDGWTVRFAGSEQSIPAEVRDRDVAATVPGSVHLDFIEAGLIPHPDSLDAEEHLQWIGWSDVRYELEFDAVDAWFEHERIDLVLGAIDTVADIRLNGTLLGRVQNMHHPHRFDLRESIRKGGNLLVVTIRGPRTHARYMQEKLGDLPCNGDWGPYCFARKSACDFGWDWGPMVGSMGIVGTVDIEAWSVARLDLVRTLVTEAGDQRGTVECVAGVEWSGDPRDDCRIRVRIDDPSGEPCGDPVMSPVDGDSGRVRLTIESPELWWPRGMGEQPLHRCECELLLDGRVLGSHQCHVGFRTVQLNQEDGALELLVNGVRIFCRGANWIPGSLFPVRMGHEDYAWYLRAAVEANMNMLRVWGGGIYESPSFYAECDRLGLLVWQDFMFACATYPEEDPYPGLVRAEARHQLSRLSSHPSIVIYCGGNEDILAWWSWGFREQVPDQRGWGSRYWLELLPDLCKELDPTRPFWNESPWSGDMETHPNCTDAGDRHVWDRRIDGYRDEVPRFVSEFGHQSPPMHRTLLEAIGEGELDSDGAEFNRRQRGWGGNQQQYDSVLKERFAEPAGFDDWLFQAHLIQARAISTGVDWYRANQPRCSGALVWQFNDVWSGHSWSCIDVARRFKPLYWSLRASFRPRNITIQPRDGSLWIVLVNETIEPWNAMVRLDQVRFTGGCEQVQQLEVLVEPGGVAWHEIPDSPQTSKRPDSSCLRASVQQLEAWWFNGLDIDLAYPDPDGLQLDVDDWNADTGRSRVTVTSSVLIRDLFIDVTRLDPGARISDNLVTLAPGDSWSFQITGVGTDQLDQLIQAPTCHSANRHGAAGS